MSLSPTPNSDTVKQSIMDTPLTPERKLKLSEVQLIDPRFLHSMRYQGIKDTEAIKELIDNSFDAYANSVYVNIWNEDDGGITIAVQDDGSGMSKETLEHCLSFGFTGMAPGYVNRIGKFGFGMSTAALSKTKRAEVYTSTKHFEYMYTYMDLDELTQTKMLLPEPGYADPFEVYGNKIQKFETGTIVILKHCDRVDFKTADTVKKHIKEDLGETYRYAIEGGKSLFVNGEPVEIIDPLMIMKNHAHRKMLTEGLKNNEITDERGYSVIYDTINLPVEYIDEKGQKAISYVVLRPVLLPMNDIYRTASTPIAAAKKYGIKMSKQGFYVMRNGRQIAAGENLGIYEKHPSLTYFRCEVEFKSELDEVFGVQVNKSRFNPSSSLKTKISEAVSKYINDSRKKYAKKEVTKDGGELPGKAEDIVKKNLAIVPRLATNATPEATDKAIQTKIQEIASDDKLDQNDKESMIKALEKTKDEKLPYMFAEEYHPRGSFYSWELEGNFTRIIINREHPFYTYYWAPTKDDEYQRTLLKFLITTLVLGEQEHRYKLDKGLKMTESQLNNIWSTQLREFLESGEFQAISEQIGKATGEVQFTDSNGEVK